MACSQRTAQKHREKADKCSHEGNSGREEGRKWSTDQAWCKQWETGHSIPWILLALGKGGTESQKEQKFLSTRISISIWEHPKNNPYHRKDPLSTYPVPLPVSLASACHSRWVCSERSSSGPAVHLSVWRKHPPPEPTAGDPSPAETPPAMGKRHWWAVVGMAGIALQGSHDCMAKTLASGTPKSQQC